MSNVVDNDDADHNFDHLGYSDHDFDDPLPMMRQHKLHMDRLKAEAEAKAKAEAEAEGKGATPAQARREMKALGLEDDVIDPFLDELFKENDDTDRGGVVSRPRKPVETPRIIERVIFKSVALGKDAEQRSALRKYVDLVNKPLPLLPGVDMENRLERIAERSPWLEPSIRIILRSLRLGSHRAEAGFHLARPILLVGSPGIGKSWLVTQMRQHLGLPSLMISAAGKNDNIALRGTARGWGSAREGEIVQLLAEQRCANPLVVVDEIDKVSPDNRNGNLQQTLLQMLDPLNAAQWRDEYLLGEVDLSAISWMATANNTKDIIDPLLDRMDIIHLQGPRTTEERRLMLRSMAWDLATEHGLLSPFIKEHPLTWPDFIQEETIIQCLLESGNNFRRYRQLLLGVVDRWLLEQKKHLM